MGSKYEPLPKGFFNDWKLPEEPPRRMAVTAWLCKGSDKARLNARLEEAEKKMSALRENYQHQLTVKQREYDENEKKRVHENKRDQEAKDLEKLQIERLKLETYENDKKRVQELKLKQMEHDENEKKRAHETKRDKEARDEMEKHRVHEMNHVRESRDLEKLIIDRVKLEAGENEKKRVHELKMALINQRNLELEVEREKLRKGIPLATPVSHEDNITTGGSHNEPFNYNGGW